MESRRRWTQCPRTKINTPDDLGIDGDLLFYRVKCKVVRVHILHGNNIDFILCNKVTDPRGGRNRILSDSKRINSPEKDSEGNSS